jgi:hypothetical protein
VGRLLIAPLRDISQCAGNPINDFFSVALVIYPQDNVTVVLVHKVRTFRVFLQEIVLRALVTQAKCKSDANALRNEANLEGLLAGRCSSILLHLGLRFACMPWSMRGL